MLFRAVDGETKDVSKNTRVARSFEEIERKEKKQADVAVDASLDREACFVSVVARTLIRSSFFSG